LDLCATLLQLRVRLLLPAVLAGQTACMAGCAAAWLTARLACMPAPPPLLHMWLAWPPVRLPACRLGWLAACSAGLLLLVPQAWLPLRLAGCPPGWPNQLVGLPSTLAHLENNMQNKILILSIIYQGYQ